MHCFLLWPTLGLSQSFLIVATFVVQLHCRIALCECSQLPNTLRRPNCHQNKSKRLRFLFNRCFYFFLRLACLKYSSQLRFQMGPFFLKFVSFAFFCFFSIFKRKFEFFPRHICPFRFYNCTTPQGSIAFLVLDPSPC